MIGASSGSRLMVVATDEEDENDNCPICLSSWAPEGQHQLCSLRCGHFFGHSCIIRALSMQPPGQSTCPVCHQRAYENQVRKHYSIGLSAKDTTKERESQQLIQRLQREIEEAKLETSLSNARILGLEIERKALHELLKKPFTSSASAEAAMTNADQSKMVPNKAAAENKSVPNGATAPRLHPSPFESLPDTKRSTVWMNEASAACWVSDEYGFAVAAFIKGRYHVVFIPQDLKDPSVRVDNGPGHEAPIVQMSARVLDGSNVLAVASSDGTISILSLQNQREVFRWTLSSSITSILYQSSSSLVVGSRDGTIYRLNPMLIDPVQESYACTEAEESVKGLVRLSTDGFFAAIFESEVWLIPSEGLLRKGLKLRFNRRYPHVRYISGTVLGYDSSFALMATSDSFRAIVYTGEIEINDRKTRTDFVTYDDVELASDEFEGRGPIAYSGCTNVIYMVDRFSKKHYNYMLSDDSLRKGFNYGTFITQVCTSSDGKYLGLLVPNGFIVRSLA